MLELSITIILASGTSMPTSITTVDTMRLILPVLKLLRTFIFCCDWNAREILRHWLHLQATQARVVDVKTEYI